jgi:hypothetical protein
MPRKKVGHAGEGADDDGACLDGKARKFPEPVIAGHFEIVHAILLRRVDSSGLDRGGTIAAFTWGRVRHCGRSTVVSGQITTVCRMPFRRSSLTMTHGRVFPNSLPSTGLSRAQ